MFLCIRLNPATEIFRGNAHRDVTYGRLTVELRVIGTECSEASRFQLQIQFYREQMEWLEHMIQFSGFLIYFKKHMIQ